MRTRLRPVRAAALLALIAGALATGASAKATEARLRHCGSETCLVIEGRRIDPRAIVTVAGHQVPIRGGRVFSVVLPLDTVRDWSVPLARSILVRTEDAAGVSERSVRLPIGLLGRDPELTALEVAVR